MPKARKNRKVIFRKVRGRVVPIKVDQEGWRGGGMYAAGLGVSLASLAGGIALNRVFSKTPTVFLKKIHESRLKAAKLRVELTDAAAISGPQVKISGANFLGVTGRGKVAQFGPKTSDSFFLHELAHASLADRKFTASRAARRVANWSLRKGPGRKARNAAWTNIKPYTDLVSEAEATVEATRTAYKIGGARKAARTAAELSPAYATYVGAATGNTMMWEGLRRMAFPVPKKKNRK